MTSAIITLAIIAILLTLSIRALIKDHKKIKTNTGACSSCSGCASKNCSLYKKGN